MASVTPASEMMPCRSEGCSKVSRRTLNLDEFAADSTLEESGFEPLVPLTMETLFGIPYFAARALHTVRSQIRSGPRGDRRFESPILQR